MRQKGTITTWFDEKGYGFITPEGGGEAVFVHVRGFGAGQVSARRPRPGEVVTYTTGPGKPGKGPQAVEVRYVGGTGIPPATIAAGAVALSFVAGLTVLVLLGRIPWWVPALYLGVSIITVLTYAADKRKAQNGEWRTPEATLHLLEACGGWPGALMAQQTLRHKNRKTPFLFVFWVIALLHISLWAWLLMSGQRI